MQKTCNVDVLNLSLTQLREYGSTVSELYQQCTAIYTRRGGRGGTQGKSS